MTAPLRACTVARAAPAAPGPVPTAEDLVRQLVQLRPDERAAALRTLHPTTSEHLFKTSTEHAHAPETRNFDWGAFDWETTPHGTAAWGMAALAALLYGKWEGQGEHDVPAVVRQRLTSAGYKVTPLLPVDVGALHAASRSSPRSVRGVVARRGDTVLAVFRGTASPKDLIYDLRLAGRMGYGGKTHSGVALGAEELWPALKAEIEAARRENGGQPPKVYLGGHSLGGGLTLLSAYRLHELGLADLQGVYLSGTPRMVDEDSADAFAQPGLGDRIWRAVNHGDILPGLVPPPPLSPYVHVGAPIYLDPHGIAHHGLSQGEMERKELLNMLGESLKCGAPKLHSIPAHGSGVYARKLYLNHDAPAQFG